MRRPAPEGGCGRRGGMGAEVGGGWGGRKGWGGKESIQNQVLLVLLKVDLSKLIKIFDVILMPTWIHFGHENLRKIYKIDFQEASEFRLIFQ